MDRITRDKTHVTSTNLAGAELLRPLRHIDIRGIDIGFLRHIRDVGLFVHIVLHRIFDDLLARAGDIAEVLVRLAVANIGYLLINFRLGVGFILGVDVIRIGFRLKLIIDIGLISFRLKLIIDIGLICFILNSVLHHAVDIAECSCITFLRVRIIRIILEDTANIGNGLAARIDTIYRDGPLVDVVLPCSPDWMVRPLPLITVV